MCGYNVREDESCGNERSLNNLKAKKILQEFDTGMKPSIYEQNRNEKGFHFTLNAVSSGTSLLSDL